MAMRFELSGTLTPETSLDPGPPNQPSILIFTYTANDSFDPAPYIAKGYKKFDVICIGGGGGQGGSIDGWLQNKNGTIPAIGYFKNPGGAGGGGGIHRVKGNLSSLPSPSSVVVGAAGAAGTSAAQSSSADATDGGASTFATSVCKASGGKAGGHSAANNNTSPANGGAGGIGGSTVAGGGGAAGVGGSPSTDAVQGTWNPATGIGSGGGGGAGGTSQYGTSTTISNVPIANFHSSNGAGGAYDAADLSVFAPGGVALPDPREAASTTYPFTQVPISPGYAGGASPFPISGGETPYGDSQTTPISQVQSSLPGLPGVVVLKISTQ